jgi:hypothetical protein
LKNALRPAALIFCIVSVALVSCNTMGSPTTAGTTTLASAPTVTTRTTPGTASGSITLAVAFYQALTVQNYEKAYSYLATDAQTLDGTVLDRASFIQIAQTADKEEGAVSEFSAAVDPTNPMCVIMSISRQQKHHYHARLFLHLYQQQWHIFSFDRI